MGAWTSEWSREKEASRAAGEPPATTSQGTRLPSRFRRVVAWRESAESVVEEARGPPALLAVLDPVIRSARHPSAPSAVQTATHHGRARRQADRISLFCTPGA